MPTPAVVKSTPKDVFLHLLSIVTLYASVVSFIALLWQCVNVWFPDQLNYYYQGIQQNMRWSASVLVVMFPVYVFLTWIINKDFDRHPERRDIKVRKWLVYLTLFISAVTVIVDVITLVYNLFGGGLTISFFLKILVVFITVAAVFGYYYLDLRGDKVRRNLKLLSWVASIIVVAAIVTGFILVGSPAHQRKLNFDQQRVTELQSIQYQLISYYQSKGSLPANLTQLKDSISGYVPPFDPETKAAYGYNVTGNLSFQLCATFDLPGSGTNVNVPRSVPVPAAPSDLYSSSWDHAAGLTCFDRTIDPQLYPVNPKTLPVK